MVTSIWFWIGFNLFILLLLALDLGVFHRKSHRVSLREAATWSVVWVTLSLLFNGLIWYVAGPQKALEFLTGYLVEKSLSVDNIFIFVLLFGAFAVPERHQHRVLFWGVLGALLMRGTLIAAGAWLLAHFHWLLYLFGGFLLLTGIRMWRASEDHTAEQADKLIGRLRRFIPLTDGYRDDKFIVREGGRWLGTPLLLVLVAIEISDLIFAVDSIPAIFAISSDAFIIYTSNVFAILGLRSLYFLLGGVINRFHYLKPGLAIILVFIGAKMLLIDLYKVPIALSLIFISAVLTGSVVLSLLKPRQQTSEAASED